MKKEDLTAIGLTDEQADKVFALNGKDIEKHKAAAEAATAAVTNLKEQLAQRDTDLAELKKLDAAGLQQKVTDLQAKYDADMKAANEKLNAQTISSHIDIALTAAKAKNLTAARALLKMDGLKLDGDKVTGLDEQIKAITKDNPYLFGETAKNPPPPSGGGNPPIDEMAKWRAEAGLPPVKQ